MRYRKLFYRIKLLFISTVLISTITGCGGSGGGGNSGTDTDNTDTTPLTYTISIVSQNGSVSKNPDIEHYNAGSVVELTATPGTGYSFSTWSSDGDGTANPLTVTVNSNLTITAQFSLETPQAEGWRVLPIRSEEEYNQGMIGGAAEQHPHSIARSLSNPDIIYFSQDVCGVWRSVDSGNTWTKTLDKGLSVNMGQSIEVDPYNPNILFLITDNTYNYFAEGSEGLFRSLDGGDSWTRVIQTDTHYNSSIHRIYRHNIAYDLSSESSSRASTWYTGFPENGIFTSEDGGTTWTDSPVSSLVGHSILYALKAHPSDGQTLYAATIKGLFRSQERGANLQAIGDLPSGAVTSIEINPDNPSIIYATIKGSSQDGLYRSSDGGQTFDIVRVFDAARVFMNPGFPETLYLVGISSNTIISHDAGDTWIEDMVTQAAPGLGRGGSWKGRIAGEISGIVPNPLNRDEAVAFSRATVWKTVDGGQIFADSSTLFTGFAWSWYNNSVAFDRNDRNRFAFFNCDVGMTITDNAGLFFDQRNAQAWGWRLSGLISWIGTYSGDFKPEAGTGEMVASVGNYFHTQLMNTSNLGEEWTILTDSSNASSNDDMNLFISYHPEDPDFVYAGDKISENGGQSFSHINFGDFSDSNPYIIGMCNGQADTVYALDSTGRRILRSDDRGKNWVEYANTTWSLRPFDPLPTFAIDPINPDKIYTIDSARDFAVFDGVSWSSKGVLSLTQGSEVGNYVRTIAVDPNHPEIIYAGTMASGYSCIFRTLDGGTVWKDITENLPRAGMSAMKVNPHTGELFKGSSMGTWIYPPPTEFYTHNNLVYDNAVSRPVK